MGGIPFGFTDGLARSRLTAIPCFVYRAYSPCNKSTPASAHSRNSFEMYESTLGASHQTLLSENKKPNN